MKHGDSSMKLGNCCSAGITTAHVPTSIGDTGISQEPQMGIPQLHVGCSQLTTGDVTRLFMTMNHIIQ